MGIDRQALQLKLTNPKLSNNGNQQSAVVKERSRELEDEQVREARLERMREHDQTLRSEETSDVKAARLERMREHAQTLRNEEG